MKHPYRVLAGCLFIVLASGCARSSESLPVATSASPPPIASSASPKPISRAAFEALPAKQRAAYENADAIVVATMVAPKIDSVLEIAPPIFVHSFGLAIEKSLSGMPLPASRLTFSSRDRDKPFVAGARVIVAVRRVEQTLEGVREDLSAIRVDEATPALETAIADAFTPAPDEVRIAIAQVAPSKHVQWQNDYGDGLFDLTLTNEGKTPRTIPGLYVVHESKGDRILFDEAIDIREEGRSLHLSHPPRPSTATPLVLAPGSSVTTRIDVKPLGIVNPAGGSRVYYSFGVGALRKSSFFYYFDSLHGPQMGKP